MVKGLNPIGNLLRILVSNVNFSLLALGAGLLGAGLSYKAHKKTIASQEKANEMNIQLQKDFAKHGISWKVQDAKDAGLHPLAALGAQTMSFSPSSVGGDYSGLERVGQYITDVIKEYEEKKNEDPTDKLLDRAIKVMTIRQMSERNSSDVRDIQSVPFDSTNVEVQPAKPTQMGKQGFEAGINPVFRYGMYPGGWVAPIPTQDVSELISEGSNPIKWRYWRDWASNGGMDIENYRAWSTEEARRWRNFLISIRPDTHPDGTKLSNNEEYRYKVGYGFHVFKKRNEMDSYFYVDKRGGIDNNNTVDLRKNKAGKKWLEKQKQEDLRKKIYWEKYPRKYNRKKKVY